MLQLSNGDIFDSYVYTRGRPKKATTGSTPTPKKRTSDFDFEKVTYPDGRIAYRGRPSKGKEKPVKDMAPGIPKRRSFNFERMDLGNGKFAFRGRPFIDKGKNDIPPHPKKRESSADFGDLALLDRITNSFIELHYLTFY